MFSVKKNSNKGIACNLALNYALGRYIAFLDSDDLWVKFKLENGIKVLSNTDFDSHILDLEDFHPK